MKVMKACSPLVASLIFSFCFLSLAQADSCEDIKGLKLPSTTINQAVAVSEGDFLAPNGRTYTVSDFCRIVGVINTNINFEVWLPATGWNGNFNGHGNGAPSNFPTHLWPGEIWTSISSHNDWTECDAGPGASYIPRNKLDAINAVVIATCDALDGLVDGLIDDPRLCDFDPYTIRCPQGEDRENCLTLNQVETVKKFYSGLRNPFTDEQIWPGFEPGSEYGWGTHIGPPWFLLLSHYKYMVFKDPSWDWHAFIGDAGFYDVIEDTHEWLAPLINATDPDLSPFKTHGGKMIMWHGWDDENIAPRNTVNYYESVVDVIGSNAETEEFLRLFMVPGMQHCGSGVGPNSFDALGALEDWVEDGIAPNYIVATNTAMSRPLCPYPKVARLKHPGLDPNDAKNFVCMPSGSKIMQSE